MNGLALLNDSFFPRKNANHQITIGKPKTRVYKRKRFGKRFGLLAIVEISRDLALGS